jgi:hypothetical protein
MGWVVSFTGNHCKNEGHASGTQQAIAYAD